MWKLSPALLPAALLLSSAALPPALPAPAVGASSARRPPQTGTRRAAPPAASSSSAPTAPRPAAAQAQTPVQFFDVAAVSRSSARSDADGNPLPPWTKVELSTVEFKTRPAAGSRVTVVPLGVPLAAMELKILKVTREMNECTAENFWRADLEPLTRRDRLAAAPLRDRRPEYPFDALVIYPAVKTYRLLNTAALAPRTLPRGVTPKAVRAAVDLDGDDQPELLYVAYCCDSPTKPLAQCDYQCSKTYLKTRNAWKLTATHEPC